MIVVLGWLKTCLRMRTKQRRIVLKLSESTTNEKENVNQYCKLYILLVFTLCSLLFSLFDSLEKLDLLN